MIFKIKNDSINDLLLDNLFLARNSQKLIYSTNSRIINVVLSKKRYWSIDEFEDGVTPLQAINQFKITPLPIFIVK